MNALEIERVGQILAVKRGRRYTTVVTKITQNSGNVVYTLAIPFSPLFKSTEEACWYMAGYWKHQFKPSYFGK